MENISFQEEPPIARATAPTTKKVSLLSRIVMGMGLAKTPKEAQTVLAIIAIVGIIIAIGIGIFATHPPTTSQSALQAAQARLDAESK